MGRGIFATAINCMDGRTQLAVINYMRERFGVDHVDMITEPGPIKALAEKADKATLESIRRRMGISVEGHGSRILAIACHHDCAGNPVAKETQLRQLSASVDTVASWGFGVEVHKLWVDENWQINAVD